MSPHGSPGEAQDGDLGPRSKATLVPSAENAGLRSETSLVVSRAGVPPGFTVQISRGLWVTVKAPLRQTQSPPPPATTLLSALPVTMTSGPSVPGTNSALLVIVASRPKQLGAAPS